MSKVKDLELEINRLHAVIDGLENEVEGLELENTKLCEEIENVKDKFKEGYGRWF